MLCVAVKTAAADHLINFVCQFEPWCLACLWPV